MTSPSTRRLAAVLIADVAGYSRLMERDEAGTHARLGEIRREVTDPAVRRHGGRVVRSVGDGFLVEFPSVNSALQAAIEIQREMASRNAGLPADRRLDHRIGINLGDILIDDSDIAGTGVNVAARLEALAPPGGIAISAAVREQARDDIGVRFVDAGQQRVKNLSQPVRVFTVDFGGTPGRAAAAPRGWLRWAAAAAALLAIFAVALWWAPWQRAAEPLPPALVVLPFQHPPQSAEAAALAESLTSQVTGAVSQLLGVTVISPAVAARYGARRAELAAIGRELHARYALDGRVEPAAGQVRIAVHLADTGSGAALWSGEMQAAAGGAVPIALVGELSDALRTAVRNAELKRVAGGPLAGSAYAVALAATDELERSTDGGQLPAIRAGFERALAIEPDHVPALAGYTHTLVYLADQAPNREEAEALLRRADEASLKAVTLRPDSAEAWAARANLLFFRDQFDAAAEAARRGLRLNPYLVMLHAFAGRIHLAKDEAEQALAAFDRGIALHPTGPLHGVLLNYRSRALLALRRFAEAVASCERGMAFGPEWPDYMLLAAAHALQGNARAAAQARERLLQLKPDFTLRWHQSLASSTASSQYERTLHDGLRLAGLPE
jgi:class 3 adenylate cyclase/TolB-like protein/tetratricopeptide (TPR) repeat protein